MTENMSLLMRIMSFPDVCVYVLGRRIHLLILPLAATTSFFPVCLHFTSHPCCAIGIDVLHLLSCLLHPWVLKWIKTRTNEIIPEGR